MRMQKLTIGEQGKRLEARYMPSHDPKSPVVLVLPSHPLKDGTLNNRVSRGLMSIFADRGFSVLAINYRGVGKSQRVHDGGEGELEDAITAIDALIEASPKASSVWIAGYDFGGWIAMQTLMRHTAIDEYVIASPLLGAQTFDGPEGARIRKNYNYNFLAPCPRSGLIISHDGGKEPDKHKKLDAKARAEFKKLRKDKVQVTISEIEALQSEAQSYNKDGDITAEAELVILKKSNEFYHGSEEQFANAVNTYITKRLPAEPDNALNSEVSQERAHD